MNVRRAFLAIAALAAIARGAAAQPATSAPKEPPPLWDWQIGASFVGTSGNTDTSTVGGDFAFHGRWPVWKVESTATAVHASDNGTSTAERYLAGLRVERKLTAILGMTAGERIERDRFSGISVRSVLDGGLSWALVRTPGWTLDAVTAAGWNHESRTTGPDLDDPIGVLQARSRIPFGAAGDTTQRVTFYPDFRESSAYRTEAEVTAQAALNSRLALKIGYLWRFDNAPVPGFRKNDNTTTASVVLRWRSLASVPL